MADRPRLFIASSTEGLHVAEALKGMLSSDVQVEAWTAGIRLSETFIEGLEREIDESDFAVLIFSGDDELVSRRWRRKAPRDNVVFESGLFMGALGRDRCFVVRDERVEQIPTDLLNVKTASYKSNTRSRQRAALQKAARKIGRWLGVTVAPSAASGADDDLRVALAEACDLIRGEIRSAKSDFDKVPSSVAARRFSRGIDGYWWTFRDWDKENSIGFVRLFIDRPDSMPKVEGRAYHKTGEPVGHWWTVASCVRPIEGELYFNFEGFHPSPKASDRPTGGPTPESEKYLGFSKYTFDSPLDNPISGRGEMSDLNETQEQVRSRLHLALRRCTPLEQQAMTRDKPDRQEIARVVQERLLQSPF